MKKKKLTPLQERWFQFYVNPDPQLDCLFNASKCAKLAGYKGSDGTLRVIGHENAKNPLIQARLAEYLEASMGVNNLTIEKVLSDLEFQRRLAIMDKQYAQANKASELQGKYLKMFVDRIEHITTVEDADTSELAELLKDVLTKIDDPNITSIIAGAGGTLTREGGDIPSERTTKPH